MNIPIPILGEVTAITITTPDLEKSLEFYKKLGFTEVMRMDFPFPWIQVSDGALLMMLRKGDTPYIALTYYVKEIDNSVKLVQDAGIEFAEIPKASDMLKRYLFRTPDGANITLIHIPEGFMQPAGPTMLTMQPQDYANPEKYVNKVCGMFGEFAMPVKDLDRSISFWEKLGFKALSKMTSHYPWAILSDGLAIIGLHQTGNFTDPTITYFASDMKAKIEKLKQDGLDNYKETGAANIVVTTPEQQKINLFSLGM
jgi:catechol 2,3-dioxygenase-like lactoylglutathione lyase family enzyme